MTEPYYIVEDRMVITWPDGADYQGVITGKLHRELHGFEVDHIIRLPNAPPGTGEKMCMELFPVLTEKYQVQWVIVKIHDGRHAEYLRSMAKRFGFTFQSRIDEMEFWRKDVG